jgi:Ca2+/Na+ antiporter
MPKGEHGPPDILFGIGGSAIYLSFHSSRPIRFPVSPAIFVFGGGLMLGLLALLVLVPLAGYQLTRPTAVVLVAIYSVCLVYDLFFTATL